MSEPHIVLRWGKGFEDPERRERARPVMRSAIDLADEGIEQLGISYNQDRTLIVEQYIKGETDFGGSWGRTLHIYTQQQKFIHRQSSINQIARVTLHELIHSIRQDTWQIDNIAEVAITEGLAYCGEYEFSWNLGVSTKGSTVERVLAVSSEKIGAVYQDFMQDGAPAPLSRARSYNNWCATSGGGVSRANKIGIACVGRLMQEGAAFSELMRQSAPRILRTAKDYL